MNPFLDWLAEVENDLLVIDATEAGLKAEAFSNMWTFSLTQQQAQGLMPDDVMSFLKAVIAARQQQVAERLGYHHPMVFYCWFDEQAAQLRFSLVSASHGRLPFGSTIHLTEDLTSIVNEFLRSPFHDGIPLEEFEAVEFEPPDPSGDYCLSVWTQQIPSTTHGQPAA